MVGSTQFHHRALYWVIGCSLFWFIACSGQIADQSPSRGIPVLLPTGGSNGTAATSLCGAGLLACNGACTNPLSDPANCGACGRSCGLGGACTNGVCACAGSALACAGSCVDSSSDQANCGACAHACGAGERCQQGQCQSLSSLCTPACSPGQTCTNNVCSCPVGQTFCAGACVDTKTTPEHCGTCDTTCSTNQLCQSGQCQCPANQTLCGKDCVDTQTSTTSCGTCMRACATGQACMAGVCVQPSGADGCDGQAHELSLREVSVYQSVKIPVMQKGAAIDEASRVASIVQGRPTLFRVFVDLGSAFTARQFSARVNITNSGTSEQYYAKQMIAKASTDADTTNTFQVYVPADKIQDGTTYSVELVECGAGSGTIMTPRFPATGEAALNTRKTGPLKITLIPVLTNSRTPDLSEATLAIYKAFLEAMYPIEQAILTVGGQVSTDYPVNWTTLIEQIRSKRAADAPAADQYYFGVVEPTATLKDYCRSGCTAGIGYVASATQAATRAAVGLGYSDETSAAVLAHEVGHNHGRNHAPCAPGNNISGVDSKYPYAGAKIGTWGFDSRKRVFFDPTTTLDIMGYCDPKWISDYTYKGLTDRVAIVNGNADQLAPAETIAAYRVMIVDSEGPRWSQPFPQPAEPFGIAENADVLDIDGNAVERVTVYRTPIGDSQAFTVLVPEPKSGWNAIKLNGTMPLPFSAPVTVPAPE